jgi:hypothetical protein
VQHEWSILHWADNFYALAVSVAAAACMFKELVQATARFGLKFNPQACSFLPNRWVAEQDNEIVVQREITRGHDLVGFSSVPGLPYRSAGITDSQGGK